MTLGQVLDAKAANQQVLFDGEPVSIIKASAQFIYVTHGAPSNDRISVTADQLSPL